MSTLTILWTTRLLAFILWETGKICGDQVEKMWKKYEKFGNS
jgi:hypothetical protein